MEIIQRKFNDFLNMNGDFTNKEKKMYIFLLCKLNIIQYRLKLLNIAIVIMAGICLLQHFKQLAKCG